MKLYDCFLFADEVELLQIRLQLLDPMVDYFVIVQAAQTFTGKPKSTHLPLSVDWYTRHKNKIRLITLSHLDGQSPWLREAHSRNSLSQGLAGMESNDLVMVSDVDELPHPAIIANLRKSKPPKSITLVLRNFNFKFNYMLMCGLDAHWAGPVVTSAATFKNAQDARDHRWKNMATGDCLYDAGWHFSYLTVTGDLSNKLASFSHQESAIQERKTSALDLIDVRQGFHDHLFPGAVWAVVAPSGLGSPELTKLIHAHPQFIIDLPPDDAVEVDIAVRHSVRRVLFSEIDKTAAFMSSKAIILELKRRLMRKMNLH